MASPYDNALKKSFMLSPEQKEMPLDKFYRESSSPTVDFSRDTLAEQQAEPAPEMDIVGKKAMGADLGSAKMAQNLAPSGADQAVSTGADALIMFGDPSMKAAGLGLKTLQAVNQAKQQQRMNKYNAEVARIQARQDAINKMAQIGQGLKA